MNLLPKEAASRLRITPGTLANLRCAGTGPRFIRFGRRVLYRECDIAAFEQAHTKTPTAALIEERAGGR